MCIVQGDRMKCGRSTEGLTALRDGVLSWGQMTVDAGFCGPSFVGSRVMIPLVAQSV